MEKDGRVITWPDAHVIWLVPFEDTVIRKYVLEPTRASGILDKLDAVHWGCLVSLEFREKYVVSIDIESDLLSDFYENNFL